MMDVTRDHTRYGDGGLVIKYKSEVVSAWRLST